MANPPPPMWYSWGMEHAALDTRTCYQALRTRDARFDGRFFTGVTTTGVFCRPVCPARTPLLRNCRFFAHAAAAQEAGYRPCLRCRPEAAPGTSPWLGTSTTVARGLRLIGTGTLGVDGIPDLAARLGVGERHLRRLFLRHLGASPHAVVHAQRVLFAKKLLDETRLPMSAVALAAGFSSVRRFNDAMRATYGRPPTALRRARQSAAAAPDLSLRLAFRPPFEWEALLGFLGARAIPGVEEVDSEAYRRTVRLPEGGGILEVRQAAGANELVATLRASCPPTFLFECVARLRRLFDLEADPSAIATHLASDAGLAPAVRRRPGLRVPGAWDGFELAVRAVLGQQVSVRAARTLAARIVARHGEPVGSPGPALRALFPRPETLAAADLTTCGLTRARARTVSALAAAVASGDVALDGTTDPETVLDALRRLPGIGEWTAQYIGMRALRLPDAFPAGDLGLRRSYARARTRPTGRGSRSRPAPALPAATEADLRRASEAWRPWRAYAAIHLWTQGE